MWLPSELEMLAFDERFRFEHAAWRRAVVELGAELGFRARRRAGR